MAVGLVGLVRDGVSSALVGMTMRAGHNICVTGDMESHYIVLACSADACPVVRRIAYLELVTEPRNHVEARLQAEAHHWRDEHMTAWAAELRERWPGEAA